MLRLFNLQLFADGGEGAAPGGEGGEAAVVNAPDDGEARLKALGVPDAALKKRADRRAKYGFTAPVIKEAPAQQEAPKEETPAPDAAAEEAPKQEEAKKLSWDEIMADPDYNAEMQKTIQNRLKKSKAAEDNLSKLAPALELLARKHGKDVENLNYEELAKAIMDDDANYEQRAIEQGMSVENLRRMDQADRVIAQQKAQEQQTLEQQKFREHIHNLDVQGEELKKTFPSFDLLAELKNPAFSRLTSPSVGLSVEDAFYTVHRKEIEDAKAKLITEQTAKQMANSIRSGANRPAENGTAAASPSVSTFNYRNASKEQREDLKRRIRTAAVRGEKIYPGQM